MRIDKKTESISDINNGTGIAKFLTIPIPTFNILHIFHVFFCYTVIPNHIRKPINHESFMTKITVQQ